METDKYIELFYDHYKDTFGQIKENLKRRDRYTIIIFSLIIFLAFKVSNPDLAKSISFEVVNQKIGKIPIDFKYLITGIYIALFGVLISYYQIILANNKLYKYLKEIEKRLSGAMNPFQIEREGINYLGNRPLLLKVINKFYSVFFPIAVILFVVFLWINEVNSVNICSWNFVINSIFLAGIAFVSLLYISHRHFNDFRKR